jgi:hypothetical protein
MHRGGESEKRLRDEKTKRQRDLRDRREDGGWKVEAGNLKPEVAA